MRNLILLLLLLLPVLTRAKDFSVTTYNVGLAYDFVDYAKERKRPLAEKLAETKSDLLCLQEVWKRKDRTEFARALMKTYPYAHFTKVEQKKADERPICKVKELLGKKAPLRCLVKNCRSKEGSEFTNCLLKTCKGPIDWLKKKNLSCARALFAQVGENVLVSTFRLLNPFKSIGMFAYGGSDGLMIFSKYPILSRKVLDHSDISTLNRRRTLVAEVGMQGKTVTFMCSHLTSDLSASVPYVGNEKSWGQENLKQIQQGLSLITEMSPSYLVWAGDFNTGPKTETYPAELPFNYDEILNSGLRNAYLEQSNPKCSYCSKNPLVEGQSTVIDHIFSIGLRADKTERMFELTERVGKGVKVPLSDHYGIRTKFTTLP